MASIRRMFVAGYLLVAGLGFWVPAVTRVFWTMLMPAVPLFVVVAGFSVWRQLCPIAALASVKPRKRRRLPRALERHALTAALGVLVASLALRLLVTNGDGAALGAFLLGMVAIAALVNRIGGGKSWCNHLCPVGVVERIYTDATSLHGGGDARCRPCTGCARRCPDLDAERAYVSGLLEADRRRAFRAFPGVVLGFYGYYWLREGSWSAFFDGRWTEAPASTRRLLAPGLFFLPEVPALIAAPATLVLGALLSRAALRFAESRLAKTAAWQSLAPGARRHRLLALASFIAFHCFYGFAGAPALMRWAGAPELVAFVVSAVAAWMAVRGATHPAGVANAKAQDPAPKRLQPVSLPVLR